MAHFYGEISNGKNKVSRTGTKNTGMNAHIRGWNVGARVELSHTGGVDVVRAYRTTGSSGRGGDELLAEFGDDASIKIHSS